MSATEPGASDERLVRRFQEGDERAFELLVRRHEARIYGLAYRMLGRHEDARDAAQDAFLSCFRHLRSFRGDASFTTWLHRIAVNACYDVLRKRPTSSSLDSEMSEPVAPRDHAEEAATAADVQRALLSLHPDFRAVLVLHEIHDLPVEEVSATLGVPVGTVKSRLHRARVALGRALAEEPRIAQAPSNPPKP